MAKTHAVPPVTGYKPLTDEEVQLMNAIKAKGDELGALIQKLEVRNRTLYSESSDHDAAAMDTFGERSRWIEEGKMQCRIGIMLLVRSVALPTNF